MVEQIKFCMLYGKYMVNVEPASTVDLRENKACVQDYSDLLGFVRVTHRI